MARCPLLWFVGFLPGCWAYRPETLDKFARDSSARDGVTMTPPGPRGSWDAECTPFPGKRVVMVTVTKEYLDMFENWLGSAKPYLLDTEQLVVVAEEAGLGKKLERHMLGKGHEFKFTVVQTDTTSTHLSGSIGDDGWNEVTQSRPMEILSWLSRGCTVLYVDIDTVWKKDPFLAIGTAGSGEIYLADDDLNSPGDNYCACFLYVQPTPTTREVMQSWGDEEARFSQYIFNQVLQRFGSLKLRVLPFEDFPPGKWADAHPTSTVLHANWYVGLERKTKFLKDHGAWDPSALVRAPDAARAQAR